MSLDASSASSLKRRKLQTMTTGLRSKSSSNSESTGNDLDRENQNLENGIKLENIEKEGNDTAKVNANVNTINNMNNASKSTRRSNSSSESPTLSNPLMDLAETLNKNKNPIHKTNSQISAPPLSTTASVNTGIPINVTNNAIYPTQVQLFHVFPIDNFNYTKRQTVYGGPRVNEDFNKKLFKAIKEILKGVKVRKGRFSKHKIQFFKLPELKF